MLKSTMTNREVKDIEQCIRQLTLVSQNAAMLVDDIQSSLAYIRRDKIPSLNCIFDLYAAAKAMREVAKTTNPDFMPKPLPDLVMPTVPQVIELPKLEMIAPGMQEPDKEWRRVTRVSREMDMSKFMFLRFCERHKIRILRPGSNSRLQVNMNDLRNVFERMQYAKQNDLSPDVVVASVEPKQLTQHAITTGIADGQVAS